MQCLSGEYNPVCGQCLLYPVQFGCGYGISCEAKFAQVVQPADIIRQLINGTAIEKQEYGIGDMAGFKYGGLDGVDRIAN